MRSWNLFCDQIKQLTSHRYVWPDGLSFDIQTALANFDQLCLHRLRDLLQLSLAEDEREYRLRRFFAMRWQVVANTSLDYTLNPSLPSNQLLLKVAKEIVKTDEAVCLILMPTIQKIVGSDLPNDIKYASEDLNGQFFPHYFLVNVDGTGLLSLENIFSYAIQDTHFLFPPLTESEVDEKKIRFELSAADSARICMLSSETARLYDYLEKNHRVSYDQKPSVGYALKILQLALLKSSKIENGSDSVANMNECHHPIKAFYEIWSGLSVDIKNQVGQYQADGSRVTLQDYLFCLFAHTPGIALSKDEFVRVRGDIVACTHMIGLQIQTILNQHIELKNIPLPEKISEFSADQVYSQDVLNICYKQHVTLLKDARVMPAHNNQQVANKHDIFYKLTRLALDSARMKESIASVCIRSMSDFLVCLGMIAREDWQFFLSSLETQMDIRYFDFVVLLKGLNEQDWNRFFALIYDKNFGDQFDVSAIAKILSEIPESQHAIFVQAIDRYVDSIFTDSIDIFYLLAGTEIHFWRQAVDYFQRQIDVILNKPGEMIQLFRVIPSEDWLSLYSLFQDIIRNHLIIPGFFELLYQRCISHERRSAIVSVISEDIDWMVVNPVLFVKVLNHLDVAEWKTVFSQFSQAHFHHLIEKPSDLFLFFERFENDDLRSVVIYHLRTHLASMYIPSSLLCEFIEVFPGCQNLLISVFRNQLPAVLNNYLDYFSAFSKNNIDPILKRNFIFLARKSLPLLLSHKTIAEQCESFRKYHDDFSETNFDPVFRLYRQLRAIERKMTTQEVSRESGSIEKLKLLSEYVTFSKTMKRTKAAFYVELVAFYGENFFANMLSNCESLLQVQGLGLFSSRVVISNSYSGPLFRPTQSHPCLKQRASSVPVGSSQNLFIQGVQMQLQPRRALEP